MTGVRSNPLWRDTSWMETAACKGTDPNKWVPAKGDVDYGPLRDLCAECPVQTECLDYAIDHPELRGLWGGMTTAERHRYRQARRRRGVA